jgi:hypothetical protein
MKKKLLLILCIIAMLVTIGVVYAAISAQYRMPQTATAPQTISATFQVNGQPWTNNTSISWGQLQVGANTMPIVVTNTGSVAISSVSINNVGLPTGWTETISMGAPSGSSIPGTITLTADTSVSGSQSWTSTITLTSP